MGLERGDVAPRFAAPIAGGTLTGQANIYQDRDAVPGGDGHKAACDVTLKDALVICDYWKKKPLVLVISLKLERCDVCQDQLDTVERVRKQYPGVNFVGVDSFESVKDAGGIVDRKGWTLPMAVDEDGAVAAEYRTPTSPAIFFIYPGGRVLRTTIGELGEQVLSRDIRELVRSSQSYPSMRQ